ncbi:unnamed protein product [Penicillium olsonii]|nr:unnamed protein product [Penicillium olsonii]
MKHKSDAAIRKQKKSIACQRCHTHKIKCSGGQPCQRCRQAGTVTECHYVNRDRQVKVHESYIEELAAENQRLRDQLSQSPANLTPRGDPEAQGMQPSFAIPVIPAHSNIDITEPADRHVQNPMLGEKAWFQPYDPSLPPIHVCEAACTAFATRIRGVLTKSDTTSHIPRTQYTGESTLMSMRNPAIQWPTLPQARLLIQVVFSQVTRVYHVVLRKSTLDQLEDAYRKADFNDPVLTCKFFALFALGEVYSARSNSSSDCKVPGVAYYVNAIMLIPILPERPSLAHIESLLVLSLYSFFLNRRHSAFLLVGSAMRLGLTLGLNHDIPESKCPNPVDRQHRIRLWWAIYVFDRMYGSKVGWPIQIADEDIYVEMPSKIAGDVHDDHNSDTEFLVASIELAKITGQVSDQIYSRKSHTDSFLQREQKLLIALKQWCFALPPQIRLHRDGPAPKNVVSLHLQFNQCIMLASRPVLLHALIQAKCSKPQDESQVAIRQTLKTLREACIHSARNTHALIMEEWINGSLPIFGYFYAHYLFSSALVMVVSSQVYADNGNDFALFEAAFEILRAMSDHGNLAAAEFYDNLECVRQCLNQSDQPEIGLSQQAGSVRLSEHSTEPLPMISSQHMGSSKDHNIPGIAETTAGNLTNDMAFLGESMEEFLAQPDIDFDLIDPSMTDGAYSWPDISLWTG